MQLRFTRNTAMCALSLASVLTSSAAFAQSEPDAWKFTAGVGVLSQPKYPGSGDRKTSVLPVLSANYGRYFIGAVPGAGTPAGIGAFLVQQPHWRLGVGLGGDLDKPRKESDSPRLTGLGDVSSTALGTVFASYNDSWGSLSGSVVTDLGGKDQGTRASMDLEFEYSPMDKLTLSAGPGFTWADGKYTETFFGINAAQSARSGKAAYTAKAGLNSVRFGVGANYQLTSQWGLGARFTASSLRGDAADSPITEKKAQNSFGLFATYRF